MFSKTCHWHECGKTFQTDNTRQKFCCKNCLLQRAAWKAKRGATLVDKLLNDDAKGLIKVRRKLLQEIKEHTK